MTERKPIGAELVKEFVLAAHASLEQVQALHKKAPGLVRASLDWGEGDWESGLEAAGHMGNIEIARFLLACGAPMTVFCAAMLGETNLVKAFLALDPKAAQQSGVHGISLMYHVALSGKVEMAELLAPQAPAGCDEALHAGVRFGHTKMVAWLLEHGACEVNILNFQQQTPLACALERGEAKIADLLRANGGHE